MKDDGGRALREERGDGGPTKEADWWKHSASSPPPFLSPSDRPGEEDEEEVQVAVVTEEATSGSSEAFCTAHLEGSANRSTRSEDRQEVTSPPSPLLKQVRFL